MAIKILFVVGVTMTLLCMTALAMGEESDKVAPKVRVSDDQLDSVLKDQRYLNWQIKCALGEAPCDSVGRRLKTVAPMILRGSCPRCTADETRQIKKVIAHIQRSYPKQWAKIVKQFAST